MSIKAAGGIRTLKETLALFEAGDNRTGSNTSAAIMKETLKSLWVNRLV